MEILIDLSPEEERIETKFYDMGQDGFSSKDILNAAERFGIELHRPFIYEEIDEVHKRFLEEQRSKK